MSSSGCHPSTTTSNTSTTSLTQMHQHPSLYSYMALSPFYVIAFLCSSAALSAAPVARRPNRQAEQAHCRLAARSARSHAASQRRGQASHPPRVHSWREGSRIQSARCSPRCSRRSGTALEVASPLGSHTAVAGGASTQRQTTHTQQRTSPSSHSCPHSQCQSCSAGCLLSDTPASGAGGDAHECVSHDDQALRQGGTARNRQTWQEANYRGVSVTAH